MRRLAMLLGACGGGGGEEPRTCDQVAADLEAERVAIQSCTDDPECGQPLAGTSCGCTRDWVARIDADPTGFYALLDEGEALGCELILDSVCECPSADGFVCTGGECFWNYTTD